MKFQTVTMIVLLATLASPIQGHHLLSSLIKKKLAALPSVLSSIAGLKSSLTAVNQIEKQASPAISISFADRLDTVEALAPAPVVHVNTVVAPVPAVHLNTVVEPAPAVYVNNVHVPAPVVHVNTVVASPAVYAYAPYYTHYASPVDYKEVHPVSIGDSHLSRINGVENVGLNIRVADEDESSPPRSATAEFNYASAY